MKRDLKGFKQGQAQPTRQDAARIMESLNGEQKRELNYMEDALKKYQDKDEKELMGELSSIAAAERKRGALTNETLDQFASTVSPMLNDEQRKRMQSILGQLKQ